MMKLRINISSLLKRKLDILSTNLPYEVSGYLTGKIIDGVIFIDDILIPRQSVSKTSAHVTPQAQVEMRQRHGDKVKQIIGQWHSHHNMGAYFSPTDLKQHREGCSFRELFVYVVSSLGNHLVRVYQQKPLRYVYSECELFSYEDSMDYLLSEIKEYVEVKDYGSYNEFEDNQKQQSSYQEEDKNPEEQVILNSSGICSKCSRDLDDVKYRTCSFCREKSRRLYHMKKK